MKGVNALTSSTEIELNFYFLKSFIEFTAIKSYKK